MRHWTDGKSICGRRDAPREAFVSSGSACSSGKVRKSHVLAAMGVPDDLAAGALRISLGTDNKIGDSTRFLDAWRDIVRICNRDEIRIAV